MENEIADYINGDFRREADLLDLDRDEIFLAMGFSVALRFPNATIGEVTAGYRLALNQLRAAIARRRRH